MKVLGLKTLLDTMLEQHPTSRDWDIIIEFPNMEVRETLRRPATQVKWEMMGGRLVIDCSSEIHR